MLRIIAIILLLFWVAGFALHLAGDVIHILLILAVVSFALHYIRGGKSA